MIIYKYLIFIKKDNKICVEYSQEISKYKKLYEIGNIIDIKVDYKLKLFVIYDVDYSRLHNVENYVKEYT